jgi:hypothetical protein
MWIFNYTETAERCHTDGEDDGVRVLLFSDLLSYSYQDFAGVCYRSKEMVFVNKDF